jgi:cytochrome c2
MKKPVKIFLIGISLVVFGIVCLLSYVKCALPNVGPAPDFKVEITPERVERGNYLANHVCVCMDCHSTRDWKRYSGPVIPGTLGKGGEAFDQNFGFPGEFYSKNITPYALKNWTDGEIFRAITEGVNNHGKALFPVMPYPAYGKMNEEDIKSIIAYLRTIPSLENNVKESSPDFPMNFIINTIPQKASPSTIPAKSDTVAYGKYLITAAACIECHSIKPKGKFVKGMEYAGGFEFPMPGTGIVRSPNITFDKETGIGNWSKETFIKRFKSFSDSTYVAPKLDPGSFNTIMPWIMFSGMTEEDLGSIYEYLKTLKPIHHQVERFTPEKKN